MLSLVSGEYYKGFTYAGQNMEVGPRSDKKLPFICKCGKKKLFYINGITTGHTKSCGECNNLDIKHGDKFSELTYIGDDINIGPGSKRKLQFSCSCGNLKEIRISSILKRGQKNCGDCSVQLMKFGQKYKSFTYVDSESKTGLWSKRRFLFRCKCGNTKDIPIFGITNGDITSCGSCYEKVFSWYKSNEHILRGLRGTVSIDEFPAGGPKPLESINGVVIPFRAECPICGYEYKPRLSDIKRGGCLTCGCTNNKISTPNREIHEFIESFGIEAVLEHKVNDKAFDIFVCKHDLLIELNGIRWHSKPNSKNSDLEKYKIAENHNMKLMMIFEDEWKEKRKVICDIISNRLNIKKEIYSLRPKECNVKKISSTEASIIYEKYHYIGGCNSNVNYGVFHKEELIGCISFRKPSRQNINFDYEISRMTMNPKFLVHGHS